MTGFFSPKIFCQPLICDNSPPQKKYFKASISLLDL
jgi:hypothetical protein